MYLLSSLTFPTRTIQLLHPFSTMHWRCEVAIAARKLLQQSPLRVLIVPAASTDFFYCITASHG